MKKHFTKLGAVIMSAAMAVSFAPCTAITLAADSEVEKVPVYGVYNPNSGEHYFTIDAAETKNLLAAGWQEGNVKWYAPTAGEEVYCLYNPNVFAPDGTPLGDHHYTSNEIERDNLLKAGWKQGNLAFYSSINTTEDRVPIYGLYNPNAYAMGYSGAHHLTYKKTEVDNLLSLGWKEGDPKFYGYAAPEEEKNYDVLADGEYSPDFRQSPDYRNIGSISNDLKMLTITTSWSNGNGSIAYPKKEYQIPISENCMVSVLDYGGDLSGPISDMMYYMNVTMENGRLLDSIVIKNAEIINFILSN